MKISTTNRCAMGAATVLVCILSLISVPGIAGAEEHSALSGEPLERLAGHGRYRGLSIVGANGGTRSGALANSG